MLYEVITEAGLRAETVCRQPAAVAGRLANRSQGRAGHPARRDQFDGSRRHAPVGEGAALRLGPATGGIGLRGEGGQAVPLYKLVSVKQVYRMAGDSSRMGRNNFV